MFQVRRDSKEPASLSVEKLKKDGKYNSDDVLEELIKIFFNKCYLCEEKNISSINVEHLIPHEGDKDLKFSWKNLFLSCSHCNNTKLSRFKNILDCTKDDVVNTIKCNFESFSQKSISIEALNSDSKTLETVTLLNLIYNGETITKKLESENIKTKIFNEINLFYDKIEYIKNILGDKLSNIDNIPENIKKELTELLSKESPFSAFKRSIVKDSRKYSILERFFD